MERIAAALVLRLISELVPRWHEVRLAELATEYFGQRLGGRELVHPDSASTLADCRKRILAIRDALAAPKRLTAYEFELTEPWCSDLDSLVDLLHGEAVLA